MQRRGAGGDLPRSTERSKHMTMKLLGVPGIQPFRTVTLLNEEVSHREKVLTQSVTPL